MKSAAEPWHPSRPSTPAGVPLARPDTAAHVQIPIEDRGPAALPKTVVKRIMVSRHHPLMVTTTSAGSVLLYDLRAPRSAVAQLKPHSSPVVRPLTLKPDL